MAFLMLLHEKMRLQRKQNKLTLKQLRNGNMLSRMESKIKKREKYYAKLEKNLETQANMFKNSAKLQLSNIFGLGQNSVNPGNLYGCSGAALQILESWGGKNPYNNKEFNSDLVKAVMNGAIEQDPSGDKKYRIAGETGAYNLTETDITNARSIMNMANGQVSQMQAQCQQVQANYENQISIWLDYQKEQLEAQQEWEMDLLAEEQSEYEADKEAIAAELELVKQRKEAIEQELGQSIKDAAPKFGLA